MNMPHIRVLLVDEHSLVRQGINALLSTQRDLTVVGEAGDGWTAMSLVRTRKPDIVVTDLFLPLLNGIETIREIRQRHPGTKVLALTADHSDRSISEALKAGASGYMLKNCGIAEVIQAIRSIHEGNAYLSPIVSAKVINGFVNDTAADGTISQLHVLTKRERQVLQLVAEGLRNKDAARQLNLSVKTIEKHRSNLMRKLEVRTVHGLISCWNSCGLRQDHTAAPSASGGPNAQNQPSRWFEHLVQSVHNPAS